MKLNSHRLTALVVSIGALMLATSASAQRILSRSALNAILGADQTFEDFESYDIAPDAFANLGRTLDSTSVLLGQGPGLVEDGATYTVPAFQVQWLGRDRTNAGSKSIRLSGFGTPRINYSSPVFALGLDLIFPRDFTPSDREQIFLDVYDTTGALVGSVTEILDNDDFGDRQFLGFEHSPGIGAVELRFTTDPGRAVTIDDHGYGVIVQPVLADEIVSITRLYSGNQTLMIDTNNCFDTQAPATTSLLQSNSCTNAENDGWILWSPNVDGMARISLCQAANFDTVLAVHRAGFPSTLVRCNDDATVSGCGLTSEGEFMAFSGANYLVQIGAFGANTHGQGTLTITENVDAIQNDECADAITLESAAAVAFDTNGAADSFPSGSCTTIGRDIWYRYTATSSADITVSTCDSFFDTVLEAFSGSCGSFSLEACNDDSCGLRSQITFTPISGETYFIRVGGFNGDVGSGHILLTQDGQIGGNYCTAVANSTGAAGTMSASGSAEVSANMVTLTASNLPNNQFGIFVVSPEQGFRPGANGSSNGHICLGSPIGRFTLPSQVLGTGTTGTFSLPIDLTAIPLSSGAVAVQAGETWNFQAWHRDAVGLGSNLTDALQISFR